MKKQTPRNPDAPNVARQSADHAKAAFKNFTLSQAVAKASTRTYLDPSKNVTAQQRDVIVRQLPNLAPTGPGLRLVTAEAAPLGMDAKGNIDLTTLVAALEASKNGVQFYAAPTGLGQKMDIQGQIDDFFSKLGAKP